MHRFLPAIASEQGVEIVEHAVNHRARKHGKSNYGISRTIRVILDLMTVKFLISYRTRPLQIFGLWGLLMTLLGGGAWIWLAYVKYMRDARSADRPRNRGGNGLLVTGVRFIMLGLLAEMQARKYHGSQDKPVYVIREVLEAQEVPRELVGPGRG